MDNPDLEAKSILLASRIGRALTTFAMIEAHLTLLFGACVGLPINVAAKLLSPVLNFSTTLSIIDVAVRHKIEGSGALPHWLSLIEYIRELSGDRNYLAHSPMTTYLPDGAPLPVDLNLGEPKVGPSINAFLTESARRPPMTSDEVQETIWDFEQAVVLLTELSSAIASSSLGKLSQPIARRRLPRSKRLAIAIPKPPSQPPSSRAQLRSRPCRP